MEEQRAPMRVRVKVSTTSKGLKSWECTVDGGESGMSADEVLAESDRLVAELEAKYPAQEGA